MSAGAYEDAGTGSVSRLIHKLKSGNDSAAAVLLQRYAGRLTAVADASLKQSSRTVSDEEDVVIDAFYAFLRRTKAGAYPELTTRDDLWRLLARITRTLAWKQSRFLNRIKRGGQASTEDPTWILSQLASKTPPPDVVASISETLTSLLEKLGDDELRNIALRRLEGLSNQEIADRSSCSLRTVERRLNVIREIWSDRA